MIAQILHSDDFNFLSYLAGKYSNKIILNHKNFFIEVRNIQKDIILQSEFFLQEFIKSQKLFYKAKSDGKTDLIILTDSLDDISGYFQQNNFKKHNTLTKEILGAIAKYFIIREYKIGNSLFAFNKPYLMGILNVTPDSFSDGGKYISAENAVKHALEMMDEGADIIDIGGESTRPGSDPVSADEEIKRVIPVIKEILNRRPEAVLSIDTYKSKVASEALKAGAKIVNDISAFTFDPEIADVCKHFGAAAVLMHIKGTPKTMQNNIEYDEIVSDIFNFLRSRTDYALEKGIEKIIIDPGIGFGKSVNDNFKIIKRLKDFKSLGFPILIGVSRKSFLGKTLNLDINERDLPTVAVEALSIFNSARIIRTHNVKNGKQIIKLLSEII
ncbi:MAG: dihydropteroate synthase [Ignavibacterium album]|uniref:dihydropteroate synthase n=1 Tax=Ignavibacterium album TaxID=591197 RepID=UPI0026ECAC54|nr:dihydropteroate synthase [Ignavibacterium album]MBI5662935.1 dihydropteroate synthase [Ignavibacterium album]